jgi:hypothetical protein
LAAPAVWILSGIAGGVLLRALRLDWQPLWWDEGYSVYFATEPVPRMLWLTARDIHPPLYYVLLHGWFALTHDTGPVSARVLSVVVGGAGLPLIAWAAHIAFPRRRWLPLVAVLLLAVNPFHVYYSQEIRMYGLALALSLAATAILLRLLTAGRNGEPTRAWLLGYVVTAMLSLWTLYYTGLLLMAHFAVALWVSRHEAARLRRYVTAGATIVALQLPWWFYALPKLLRYIADKVIADQDTALGPLHYVWRHLIALSVGHSAPPTEWAGALQVAAPILVLGLPLGLATALAFPLLHEEDRRSMRVLGGLAALPFALAFLISLRFPFFPVGGERLLLFVLPYVLLLVACALDVLRVRPWLALLAWLGVLIPSAAGLWAFYTTPRYADHDYRPIVRYVTQHSQDTDTVLAIFPWQVGYWRTYSPRNAADGYVLPQPPALDQDALEWSPGLAADLEAALRQGVVWFPAPLSFGSTLPGEIESYLAGRAANVDNRWFGPATRLSAWTQTGSVMPRDMFADFGPVVLAYVGAGPRTVRAANEPVLVDLVWRAADPAGLTATLRLLDDESYVWAQRDLSPLGSYPVGAERPGDRIDRVALTIPAGTPPGTYRLAVGVSVNGSEQMLSTPGANYLGLLTVAELTVLEPDQPLPAARLPAPAVPRRPLAAAGVRLIGYAAPDAGRPVMAGTALAVDLYVQATQARPPIRDVAVALADPDDTVRAGWQGWPLPAYPAADWPDGALVTLPVSIDLPADMTPGVYHIEISFAAGAATTTLAALTVVRRTASFTATTPAVPLDQPVQFGAHARLVGYDLTTGNDRLDLALHWEALQPLLPQHEIFVHLYDLTGTRVAQQDGPPQTSAGNAPTGSWLPGERLVTHHTIALDTALPPARDGWTLRVGLYYPPDGVRLPASVAGVATGDAAVLPLH